MNKSILSSQSFSFAQEQPGTLPAGWLVGWSASPAEVLLNGACLQTTRNLPDQLCWRSRAMELFPGVCDPIRRLPTDSLRSGSKLSADLRIRPVELSGASKMQVIITSRAPTHLKTTYLFTTPNVVTDRR